MEEDFKALDLEKRELTDELEATQLCQQEREAEIRGLKEELSSVQYELQESKKEFEESNRHHESSKGPIK